MQGAPLFELNGRAGVRLNTGCRRTVVLRKTQTVIQVGFRVSGGGVPKSEALKASQRESTSTERVFGGWPIPRFSDDMCLMLSERPGERLCPCSWATCFCLVVSLNPSCKRLWLHSQCWLQATHILTHFAFNDCCLLARCSLCTFIAPAL